MKGGNVASAGVKGVFAGVSRVAFNVLYRAFCIGGRRNEVLFVSRKSDTPSYDYLECGAAFEKRGMKSVYLSAHFKKSAVASYFVLVMKELYHLARCKVCVIDRYDPVVSLLDFKCQPARRGSADGGLVGDAHSDSSVQGEFPVEPVVVQLWHAFGAYKKFGYQCVDIAEGHSSVETSQFKIHRNNSWVVCSGEGSRRAFAEAFNCPMERVVPLSRPEYRKLLDLREKDARDEAESVGIDECRVKNRAEKLMVMFAPTIRKYDAAADPFGQLKRSDFQERYLRDFDVLWSDHPLVAGADAKGDIPKGLQDAQLVVTDYSSIVYEAYLLNKMVCFYVPDIDHYRKSPGLNVDPEVACPSLVAKSPQQLAEKLRVYAADPTIYPWNEFANFIGDAFAGCGSDPATDLVDFLEERYPDLCTR